MSFIRRNKDPQPQVVPAPAAPASEEKSGGGLIQWLKDSYNGLYKIVIEPSMPTRLTILLLLLGLLIGLVWAYRIQPPIFAGGNPNRLNQAAQDQWILMTGGNYVRRFYDVNETVALLDQVDNPAAAIDRLLQSPTLSESDREALLAIQPLAQQIGGTPTPQDPGLLNNLLTGFLVPILIIVIATPVLVVVWRMLIYPNFVAPVIMRIREARDPALRAKNAAARADLRRLQEQKAELDRIKKETIADIELGEPVTQVLKVYAKGRSYDESDEIESGDDFLGQCGSVIPESVAPDPLAVEVWLFDMFATGDQNHKKLFVTEAAAADPAIRQRLLSDPEVSPDEWVIARPGAKLVIDSEKIRLQGELTSVEVGASGRFESFRLKVSAWKKSGRSVAPAMPATVAAAPIPPMSSPLPPAPQPSAPQFSGFQAPRPLQSPAPTPLGGRPMSDYNDIQFDPPPAPTAPRPLSQPGFPPPAPGYGTQRFTEDDDPFGNTGDFTPLPPRS
jgi:hypothetical protein